MVQGGSYLSVPLMDCLVASAMLPQGLSFFAFAQGGLPIARSTNSTAEREHLRVENLLCGPQVQVPVMEQSSWAPFIPTVLTQNNFQIVRMTVAEEGTSLQRMHVVYERVTVI